MKRTNSAGVGIEPTQSFTGNAIISFCMYTWEALRLYKLNSVVVSFSTETCNHFLIESWIDIGVRCLNGPAWLR